MVQRRKGGVRRRRFNPTAYNNQIWLYGGVTEPFVGQLFYDLRIRGRRLVKGDDGNHPRRESRKPIASCIHVFKTGLCLFGKFRSVSPVGRTKMRAELMGHGPEINQSVYTKVIPESLRNAVANVPSELFANCSQSPNWVN
jgi:hypothetical protein